MSDNTCVNTSVQLTVFVNLSSAYVYNGRQSEILRSGY